MEEVKEPTNAYGFDETEISIMAALPHCRTCQGWAIGLCFGCLKKNVDYLPKSIFYRILEYQNNKRKNNGAGYLIDKLNGPRRKVRPLTPLEQQVFDRYYQIYYERRKLNPKPWGPLTICSLKSRARWMAVSRMKDWKRVKHKKGATISAKRQMRRLLEHKIRQELNQIEAQNRPISDEFRERKKVNL